MLPVPRHWWELCGVGVKLVDNELLSPLPLPMCQVVAQMAEMMKDPGTESFLEAERAEYQNDIFR